MATSTYLPPPNPDVEARVAPPAVAIIVVAVMGLVAALGMLGVIVLGIGAALINDLPRHERAEQFVGGTFWIVWCVTSLILYSVAIWGALKMKALRSYGAAVTATIVMLLPCSCCCFIGIPIGIWSLVVLLSADVKAAFSA